MSYCGNCGFEITENAKFCGRCGSSLVDEDIGNNGLISNEASRMNETSEINQTIKKPFYMSKAFIAITVVVAVILAATVFFGVKYFSARSLYNKGISQLEQLKWADARNSLEDAKKTGLIFYQDGPEVYKERLDSYIKQQVLKAKSLLEKEDYKGLNDLLANLPKDSSYTKDIEDLKDMRSVKAVEKLKSIDKMVDEGDYSQALEELKKFKSIFTFDNFQTEVEKRIQDINSRLDRQQEEDKQAALDNITDTANKLIFNYDNSWADAVNTNNFSLVEPYLLKDSSLYNAQKSVLKNITAQGIREQLVDFSVIGFSLTSDSNVYKVYVYEEFNIISKDGQSKKTGFNWVYTMHLSPQPALSDIEKDTRHTGKE